MLFRSLTFLLFGSWFSLSALKFADLLIMVVLMGLAWPVMHVLSLGTEKLRSLFPLKFFRKNAFPGTAEGGGPAEAAPESGSDPEI